MKNYILKLINSATDWENATPIGNGCMGAMIYGSVDTERIQLNHEKFWSNQERDTTAPDFKEKIDHVRKLFLEGKNYEAEQWAKENLSHTQHRISSYETAGELLIKMHSDCRCEDYKRDLSLNDGIATVSYKRSGVNFSRSYFASYPAKAIVLKFSADKEKSISFDASFERENLLSCEIEENTIKTVIKTAFGEHLMTVKAEFLPSGGDLSIGENKLCLIGADECVIFITFSYEQSKIKSYDTMLSEHIADFSALMERSDIALEENPEAEKLPVNKRLEALRAGKEDNGLFSLYFQFGKYLLISSSRAGTLPANLQGVWNGEIKAPWNSDYHTNINLQMNYWPSEVANLSECHMPLFDYIENYILESGKRTARINYKCEGMVLHHLSDIYGFTTPADGMWGIWPLGGAWLCYHYFEHYLYTLDLDFLKKRAYNVIKENVLFFLDYMFEDSEGRLLSGPSMSPENVYVASGEPVFLCLSPTMDVEIIGGLFRIFLQIENILKIKSDLNDRVKFAMDKLPPLQIGKNGQLMEWMEDYEEAQPGHRHISHAFALYPDCAINPDTPELFEALKKTIELRLENGGGHTGWSRAWIILMYARLLMPEEALQNFCELLKKSTNDSLLDIHPPFQIDGNFGGAAGLAEMLLQSQKGVISLLPALPKSFKKGEVKGLCCRGGVTVDFDFDDGKLTSAVFYSKKPRTVKVKYLDTLKEITVNGKYVLDV